MEIVTDKSQEGSQFVRGFGGIGGVLKLYMFCKLLSLLYCCAVGLLRYKVEFSNEDDFLLDGNFSDDSDEEGF